MRSIEPAAVHPRRSLPWSHSRWLRPLLRPLLVLAFLAGSAPGPTLAQVDLVFANAEEPNRVCLADGAGGFACSDLDATALRSRDVALADFDGVGGLDLVIANIGGPNQVCLNDGSGSFTCNDLSPESLNSRGLAVADLDGVNGPDVVIATSFSANRVCLNDGGGSFSCSDVEGGTSSHHAVALADLDGFGGIDAVFAGFSTTRERVCLNDGTGSFSCSDVDGEVLSTQDVALADLDGINGVDAVFASRPNPRVCLNDGTGSFTCSHLDLGVASSFAVALGDLDGVNGPDAYIAGQTQLFALDFVCLNDGDGGFACTSSEPLDDFTVGVELTDIDGDGDLDAALAAFGSQLVGPGTNRVCINDGAGLLSCGDVEAAAIDSAAVAAGRLRTADLTIDVDDGQTAAVPGTAITYAVTVDNLGPAATPAASVTDVFPPQLDCTWTCAGSGGGVCTAGPVGGDIVDSVALPAGGAVTYTASCSIDAGATGVLGNSAAVNVAVVIDPDAVNDRATDRDTLTPEAGLSVTKDDGVALALPGDVLSYTIVARNAGPSHAPTPLVVDAFPAELIDCAWTCAAAGGADCIPGPVAADLVDRPFLPVGGVATYTAVCTVDPGASFALLENTVTVSPPLGVVDPDASDDAATDRDVGPLALVFADGFESGDLSAWSAVVP